MSLCPLPNASVQKCCCHAHNGHSAGLDQLAGQGLQQGAQALSSTLQAAQRGPEAVLQELNAAAQQSMGLARTMAQAGMQQAQVGVQGACSCTGLLSGSAWLERAHLGTLPGMLYLSRHLSQAHVGCWPAQSYMRCRRNGMDSSNRHAFVCQCSRRHKLNIEPSLHDYCSPALLFLSLDMTAPAQVLHQQTGAAVQEGAWRTGLPDQPPFGTPGKHQRCRS